MTAIDLVGIVGVEDHPQAGVGVGGLAGHLGHDDHLVGRGSEDGLQAPGDAGADAADGGFLAPAVEASAVLRSVLVLSGCHIPDDLVTVLGFHVSILAGKPPARAGPVAVPRARQGGASSGSVQQTWPGCTPSGGSAPGQALCRNCAVLSDIEVTKVLNAFSNSFSSPVRAQLLEDAAEPVVGAGEVGSPT